MKFKPLREWLLRPFMMWPKPTFPILRLSTPITKSCSWLKPKTRSLFPTSCIFPVLCHCSSCWWWLPPLSLHSKFYYALRISLVVLHGAFLKHLSLAPTPTSGVAFCVPVLWNDFLPCLILINIYYLYLYLISFTLKNDHWQVDFYFIFLFPKVLSEVLVWQVAATLKELAVK